PRLCPAVSHGWFSGVPDGVADPLWAVGAAVTPPGQRTTPQAALDAPAAVALRPGGQDCTPAAPGAGAAPRGIWLPGNHQCRVGSPGLPDQHRVHRAPQPDHPPARGGGGTAGQHALQGRSGLAAAGGRLALLLQLLFAPPERTPAPATARVHPRDRLSHAVAALYAGHGGGLDGPCLVAARGAPVPCAAVAAARGGVSKQERWAAASEGDLSRRRASTRPAARTSTGGRGPLGGRESPLS